MNQNPTPLDVARAITGTMEELASIARACISTHATDRPRQLVMEFGLVALERLAVLKGLTFEDAMMQVMWPPEDTEQE